MVPYFLEKCGRRFHEVLNDIGTYLLMFKKIHTDVSMDQFRYIKIHTWL